MTKYKKLKDLLDAYQKGKFYPEDHRFSTCGGKVSVVDEDGSCVFEIRLASRRDSYTDNASNQIGELFYSGVYSKDRAY